MLYLARSLSRLHFSSLMAVYAESNRENGREFWPEEPEMRQIQLAEEDFYRYLSQVFFRSPGAVYAVWEENGRYVSALRLEPYRDGLLLEALETAPEQRRKGFAAALIRAVQCFLEGKTKLYSHVDKRNLSSLKVHEKCGFRRVADFAVCVDGSVNQKCTPCVGTTKPPYDFGHTEVFRDGACALTYLPRSGAFLPENSGCFPQRSPEAAGGFPAAPMPCGA